MPILTVINDQQILKIECDRNSNLLEVLREHGIPITADCGGNHTCKKCRVRCQNQVLLACETIVTGDMTIELSGFRANRTYANFGGDFFVNAEAGYGIAIDIGTTTVESVLVDLEDGHIMDQISELNRQIPYGTDVITRIRAAREGKLHELHKALLMQCNRLIAAYKSRNHIEKILRLVLTGNTVMFHFFANIDPSSMGEAPYLPVFTDSEEFEGKFLAIDCDTIVMMPSVSAFIGSDTVCGILSSGISEKPGTLILIDIGTNGEIVLKTKDHLYACSTAAGPAFEGAGIECGLGGIDGAISHFSFHDDLDFETVSGSTAIGICGSGLVDLLAILRTEDIIDETGALNPYAESKLTERISNDRFYVSENVYITQKDIREFQLAKSAILSGIQVLLDIAGIAASDIDGIDLAGGLGAFCNVTHAQTIGLLPDVPYSKIHAIGNSALSGARMVLCNSGYKAKTAEIAKELTVISLSKNPLFSRHFIENMIFPIIIKK